MLTITTKPLVLTLLISSFTFAQLKTPRLTTLHGFAGGVDGNSPTMRLVSDKAGALYGTTANGGFQFRRASPSGFRDGLLLGPVSVVWREFLKTGRQVGQVGHQAGARPLQRAHAHERRDSIRACARIREIGK